MTHNEKRTHWVKEGGIGLATGILFGLTNVVVGHVIVIFFIKLQIKHPINLSHLYQPFDTIKTKMQAQKGYENLNMIKSFIHVFKTQGITGFYRYSSCLFLLLISFNSINQ